MSASKSSSSSRRSRPRKKTPARRSSGATQQVAGMADGLASVVEQLVNKILAPLDMVVISRERIQQTLDEAAERGRMTRSDANDLVAELIRRGRQQTDELLSDMERLMGRGRTQLDSARKRARESEPVDQLVRAADRARQSVGAQTPLPISAYDEMTASQVNKRLGNLDRLDLRRVREYESRHANRKSVLEAIDRALR
jgi:polyhydroxyalkanoate synthesis regulator phasin